MNTTLISKAEAGRIGLYAWIFCLVLAGIGFAQAWLVNGQLCYALDDSFIMMAISKNFAIHNVWGLTQHEFSSTASSPLFATILAGFILIFGDQVWLPLFINVLALLGLCVWLSQAARSWNFNRWQIWILEMGLIFFMPIPVLLFGSMEHILHTWIALVCFYELVDREADHNYFVYFLMGAFLSSIRYEGLFEGGLIVLWMWKKNKWIPGFVFGFGLIFSISILGFYSLSKGSYFLPNSLVLKGYNLNIAVYDSVLKYLMTFVEKATQYHHMVALMLILVLVIGDNISKKYDNRIFLIFILIFNVLHFVFARYGHVYRYEGYLIGMSWVYLWKTFCQSLQIRNYNSVVDVLVESSSLTFFVILLTFGLSLRSLAAYKNGTRAMVNIYEQQVQTADFIKKYFNEKPIAAIDVGAIAYYSDCKLLDIWGLGSIELARMKMNHTYSNDRIDSLCRVKGVEIALVYKRYWDHPSWKKVGSWIISHNAVCAADTVDFFTLRPENAHVLKTNLVNFESQIPKTVQVKYW